jgi:hypothetical protein
MGDLRPLGSEKLQGSDKLKRIMEIATYGQSTESDKQYKSAEYTIQLADGNHYGIVKEKTGYIVKKGINESELDYIEPMKNRKHYKSFSQAMKKINLLAGELNRIHEHVENISLIGEQKKFVLKTPESEKPAAEPTPEPSDSELDLDLDMGGDETEGGDELDLDMGGDELDLDMGGDETEGGDELDLDMGGDETEGGADGLKIIQKLTGKLGQKLRTMDQKQGLSSEDIKYVLNSIISAVDLAKLSEEDREDVLSKFESDDIIDYGVDDEAELDIDVGEDELDFDLDLDMDDEESEQTDTEVSEQGNRYMGIGGRFFDENDREFTGDFDFEYDEEEYDDFDEFMSKHSENQMWFQKERKGVKDLSSDGRTSFNRTKDFYKEPFKLRKRRMNDEMMEQGMDEMSKIVDEIFTESKVDKVLNRYFKESNTEKVINEEKKIKNFLNDKIKNVSIKKEVKKLSESIEQELASEFLIKENNNINLLGKTNLKNLLFEINGVKYKITTKGEII